MRIGEAAEYLGMSVVGERKAASEGPLASRRSGSGHRTFERADLDAYLGRPVAERVPRERVEALYRRVSGSTGQESSLANQEIMLRYSASGVVYRVYKDRGSGLRDEGGAGSAARRRRERPFHSGPSGVAGSVGTVRVARIERYLSVLGVTVEVLREHGDTSLVEELMNDFMALLASFSGRFHRFRSKQSQRRLLDDAAARLEHG